MLLIDLEGKVKHAEKYILRIKCEEDRETVWGFIKLRKQLK